MNTASPVKTLSRFTLAALLAPSLALAAPLFESQELFASYPPGTGPAALAADPKSAVKVFPYDNHFYHVPGIVVTRNGVVLAFAEWRRAWDWGDIHINLRRSLDGGKTWDAERQIAHYKIPIESIVNTSPPKPKGEEDAVVIGNPTAIADQKNGVVHFLYCADYRRCFYMRSDDDGKTFSDPVEITDVIEQFRPEYDWKIVATGPGHGIQLENGRLIVPIWLSTGGQSGHQHSPSVTAVIYSDDAGKTWKRGDIVARSSEGGTPAQEVWHDPNEAEAVQLADGSVLINMRTRTGERRRRIQSISPDGATGWSKPEFVDDLYEPTCMGSIQRYSKAPLQEKNRLLFSNPRPPEGKNQRENLTVSLSYDEGKTWPVRRVLWAGVLGPGYSDLAVLRDGTILCVHGIPHSSKGGGGSIAISRFNLEWLTAGKDKGEPLPARQP
jgi:sialidase-1